MLRTDMRTFSRGRYFSRALFLREVRSFPTWCMPQGEKRCAGYNDSVVIRMRKEQQQRSSSRETGDERRRRPLFASARIAKANVYVAQRASCPSFLCASVSISVSVSPLYCCLDPRQCFIVTSHINIYGASWSFLKPPVKKNQGLCNSSSPLMQTKRRPGPRHTLTMLAHVCSRRPISFANHARASRYVLLPPSESCDSWSSL